MIGTAITPLMTALQNSALIGSIGVKSSATPPKRRERDDRVELAASRACRSRPLFHSNVSATAYAADPASTGTASIPVPMMPRLNSRNVGVAGERPQRLGRLRPRSGCRAMPAACSVAAALTMMKSAIRFEKPMPMYVSILIRRRCRRAVSGACVSGAAAGSGIDLLDFLRRLPEEEIGADRRAEQRDDDGQRFAGQREPRPDDAGERLAPRYGDREHHGDVRQQRERQPLEVADVALVGQEHLQQQAGDAEDDRMAVLGAADDELQRVAHRCDVCGHVDRIGDHQHRDDRVEDRPRKVADGCSPRGRDRSPDPSARSPSECRPSADR